MSTCAVSHCKNYGKKTQKDIAFFQFPVDPYLRQIWVEKCNRIRPFNMSRARICSDHFLPEDYQRDLRAELMNTPMKKMLKANAVPSQKLDPVVVKPPEETNGTSSQNGDLSTLEDDNYKKQLQEKIGVLEDQVKNLTNTNNRLFSKNKSLLISITTLQLTKKRLNQCYSKTLREHIKNVFKNIISDNQAKCLSTRKYCKEWNEEDMCKSICLRSVSKPTYIFLRKKFGFPFPSLFTLKKWVNTSLAFQPGILHDILELMKAKSNFLSDMDKICILSFDEMSVDNRISYDQAEDRIMSPHKHVLVVMLSGLFSSWRQTIFYKFDVTMTKGLLFEIILAIEKASFRVAGIVSDFGGKFRSLLVTLRVNQDNPSFLNPANNDRTIWVFASASHLLKQLRNNLLDHGLTLVNNQHVRKSMIEKLLFVNPTLCPELSIHHLNIRGQDRHKVDLAAQLLSTQTAKAIKFLMPKEEAVSNFFQLTNDVFAILNSSEPNDGFGLNIKTQEHTLNKFYNLIIDLRVGKKKKMMTFQKGFLLTINSLLGLYSDMKDLGITYILTSKLTLDCLESFFSSLRSLDHFYDPLLPSEVKSRVRKLLLGNTGTKISFSNESSVKQNEDSKFLSSELLNPLLAEKTIDSHFDEELREDCNIFSIKDDFTSEDLKHLAEYIGFKCKKEDDPLGSGVTIKTEFDNPSVGWIKNIYKGGLMISSAEWLLLIENFEFIFNELHGQKGLSREKGIVKKLCSILSQKFPLVSMEVIEVYARTRTFIQIRYWNRQVKSQK